MENIFTLKDGDVYDVIYGSSGNLTENLDRIRKDNVVTLIGGVNVIQLIPGRPGSIQFAQTIVYSPKVVEEVKSDDKFIDECKKSIYKSCEIPADVLKTIMDKNNYESVVKEASYIGNISLCQGPYGGKLIKLSASYDIVVRIHMYIQMRHPDERIDKDFIIPKQNDPNCEIEYFGNTKVRNYEVFIPMKYWDDMHCLVSDHFSKEILKYNEGVEDLYADIFTKKMELIFRSSVDEMSKNDFEMFKNCKSIIRF